MRRLLCPGPFVGLRSTSIALLLLLGAGPTLRGQDQTAADDPGGTPRSDPKLARDYLDSGDAWRAKGEFDKAIDSYTRAIHFDPNNAYAYAARGQRVGLGTTFGRRPPITRRRSPWSRGIPRTGSAVASSGRVRGVMSGPWPTSTRPSV